MSIILIAKIGISHGKNKSSFFGLIWEKDKFLKPPPPPPCLEKTKNDHFLFCSHPFLRKTQPSLRGKKCTVKWSVHIRMLWIDSLFRSYNSRSISNYRKDSWNSTKKVLNWVIETYLVSQLLTCLEANVSQFQHIYVTASEKLQIFFVANFPNSSSENLPPHIFLKNAAGRFFFLWLSFVTFFSHVWYLEPVIVIGNLYRLCHC